MGSGYYRGYFYYYSFFLDRIDIDNFNFKLI